jgi:predicted secreted protein
MTITAALVLFAVIWFMVFFIVLPLRFTAQGDTGQVVPGTPRSAPADHMLRQKAWITTGIAAVLWAVIAGIIISGVVSLSDIDLFDRMRPTFGS